LPHNFSYLQPNNFSGFLFEHLPRGFGYSAESHVILEGFEKDSNIEFDNESGLRPDNYTVDFITNELGVSNVRFFLSESYHLPLHYSLNFDNSSDSATAYTPVAFSQLSRVTFGPYYELSLWLTLIRPSRGSAAFSNSFANFSLLPSVIFSNNIFFGNTALAGDFSSRYSTDFTAHTFVKRIYLVTINFFYFLLRIFFLRLLGPLHYNFSRSNSLMNICSDFSYIFFASYPRPGLFKEFFKFIIFINKNYKLKKLSIRNTPVFFFALMELYSTLYRLETFYSSGVFYFFFARRFRYAHLCRVKLGRLLKDLS